MLDENPRTQKTLCTLKKRLSVTALPQTLLNSLKEGLRASHHLDGSYGEWSHPVLAFRVPPAAAKMSDHLYEEGVKVFPVLHMGEFGASFVVRARFQKTGEASHVAVPFATTLCDRLRDGSFSTVFFHGLRPVLALDWHLSAGSDLAERWPAFRQHEPTVDDPSANYFDTIETVDAYRCCLTANDRLSIGWVATYRARVVDLQNTLSGLAISKPLPCPLSPSDPQPLEECVRVFLETLRDANYRLAQLVAWMKSEIGNDGHRLCWLFSAGHRLFDDEQLKEYGPVLREACETYAWSSWYTECGHRMPWIDTLAGTISTLELLPHDFPEGFPEQEYWRRQIWDLPYQSGEILRGYDVPIDPREMVARATDFPHVENVEDIRRCGDDYMDDAVANKQWTIPRGAVVELSVGPFTHMELFEIGENVFFLFRTSTGETHTGTLAPADHVCEFHFPRGLPGLTTEREEGIKAGIQLLMSAIVRDFWVVEEREKIFSHYRTAKPSYPRGEASDRPRIVYLPRIRYTHKPNVEAASRSLGYAERRAHWVSAHLRRSASSSEHQLILAKRYGFDVPEGFTFVRPHERGKMKRDVVYRSRSALQSLYTVAGESQGRPGGVRWFQFERDVRDLMEALGFVVEHAAASRHGDNGVDVYATKGEDIDRVNWVIQCKCYHPQRKVGPSTIRDLEGTLTSYPRGTRGMVVATCRFSSGARERAAEADIRLVDGEEFAQWVASVRSTQRDSDGGVAD